MVSPFDNGPGCGRKGCTGDFIHLGPEELVQAVAAQDKAAMSRANGVGPKLAGRIVLELKDKVGNLVSATLPQAAASSAPAGGDSERDLRFG